MVFPALMHGEVPDFRGGSDFQILDQLKDKKIRGKTIRHWSGTIRKVDADGNHVNNLKQGFVEVDHKGGHYVGEVDEDE